jgi:hypothetical protein
VKLSVLAGDGVLLHTIHEHLQLGRPSFDEVAVTRSSAHSANLRLSIDGWNAWPGSWVTG